MATDFTIPARDGYPLAASLFESTAAARRGVVVINSAMAVKRSFYAKFATWLATQGFDVVTYDNRGIGGSRPKDGLRNFKGSLRQWGEADFPAVLDWARGERKVESVLLVGHSVGGQLLGLADNVDKVAAAFCVASQSGHWRLWPTLGGKAKMVLYMYAMLPVVGGALGYVPGKLGMGEDLPHTVAGEWARWCRTKGYLMGDDASRRERYGRVTFPIQALSFSDDTYAPKETIDALLGFFTNAKTAHEHVVPPTPVGHFGFFRSAAEQTYWPKASKWLSANAP